MSLTPYLHPTAVVYRAYNAAGQLLYVGCTGSPKARMKDHSQRAPWWSEHVRIEISDRMSTRDALDLETEAIWALGPIYNQPHPRDLLSFDRAEGALLRFRPARVSESDDLLTSPQAAAILGISARTVQRKADAGEIRVAQKLPGPNGAYLYRRADIEALLPPAERRAS